MNERIKELAEQAQGTKKYVPPVWQFYDEELQNFAESLVEYVCYSIIDLSGGNEQVIQAVKHLEKHFDIRMIE